MKSEYFLPPSCVRLSRVDEYPEDIRSYLSLGTIWRNFVLSLFGYNLEGLFSEPHIGGLSWTTEQENAPISKTHQWPQLHGEGKQIGYGL